MATIQANTILRQVRRWAARQGSSGAADAELVRRFVVQRDEAAFEILVHRHGPMVLRVCRGVLRDRHDADDAFQATFVLLARKAGTLRRSDVVGGWLHGVARRVALKARVESARRRAREKQVTPVSPKEPLADITVREAQAILDEELARLPEKYRTPLILCCLEGQTRDEAANELACSPGSLKDRLERGRELLRG
jgi:RNA polymerase sigma factor (sigma-70 family)